MLGELGRRLKTVRMAGGCLIFESFGWCALDCTGMIKCAFVLFFGGGYGESFCCGFYVGVYQHIDSPRL